MQRQLVIIGAGGLGREVAALVDDINNATATPQWELLGFVDDDPSKVGTSVACRKVVGSRAWLLDNPKVWAVLAVGNSSARLAMANEMPGVKWATLVHPKTLMPSAFKPNIGNGAVIFGGAILSTDVAIGKHSLIYYGCTISHDVSLGSFTTVLPACNIAGNVQIGDRVTLGIGTKVAHNICIHPNTCLAAGSVVVKDLPGGCLAAGVPATIRKRQYTSDEFWA
jgi:sugar O-acyltransferase (sialic acid O-acetyltransferase NeuD family)